MERTTNDKVLRAKALRRSATPPERLLWQALRLKPGGLKFRRQHPVGSYTADFYCASLKLVIEVDGDVHDMGDHPEQDAKRDQWLKDQGFQVLRFNAADIFKDVESAVTAITRLA